MKNILAFLFFLTLISVATAGTVLGHEMWLLPAEDIKVGEETEVRVYWGHFSEAPDPASSYYRQLLSGRLVMIAPDGIETELSLQDAGEYYTARYTPGQAGDHWAVFSHDRGVLDWTHGEPQGRQAITVYAKALLDVHGDNETVAFSRLAGHNLEILPLVDGGHLHTGEPYMAQLMYFGSPLSGVNVLIYGPDDRSLETATGPGGTFSFVPDKEGDWLLKVSYFDDTVKEKDGVEIIGARYTLTLLVSPHDVHAEFSLPVLPQPEPPASANYVPYLGAIITLLILAALFFRSSRRR
jgi:uncharacterized GH25 family protein